MNQPLKVLVVTDSAGHPRSFPPSELVELEETFPYLLRQQLPGATFWQLSFGTTPTPKMLSQPMGYLTHWAPDFIVIQSGMADCHPSAMTDFEKEVVRRLTGPLYGRLFKYLNHPRALKYRQAVPVSPTAFRRTLRQFKLVFPKAKIIWLEICAGPASEVKTPGLHKKMQEYNDILADVYGSDFVKIHETMCAVEGYNSQDHTHWNKRGHAAVAEIVMKIIRATIEHQTVA